MADAPATVLGFDFGTRRIGVAAGQAITGGATALPALRCDSGGPDWQAIARLLDEWQPEGLVVGLPLNMDDSEGDSARRGRRFARRLEGRFHRPVWLVDERLSTREARERVGNVRRDGGDPRVDSEAAVLIIEGFYRDGGQRP